MVTNRIQCLEMYFTHLLKIKTVSKMGVEKIGPLGPFFKLDRNVLICLSRFVDLCLDDLCCLFMSHLSFVR